MTMRIHVDLARCTGHGRCYTLAPDVFDCDDEGYSILKNGDVAPEYEAQALAAQNNCPEGAITVTGDAPA